MKLLVSVFLALAVNVVTVYSDDVPQPVPVKACPPEKVLGKTAGHQCTCTTLPTITITCTDINQQWLKDFEPGKLYQVNILKIIDSPDFPYFQDKFHHNPANQTGIMAETVIFTLNKDSKIKEYAMKSLLSVASKEIKVKSTKVPIVIHNPTFQSSLEKIAFENVKFTELDTQIFENLNSLKTLQLNKVSFETILPTLVIKNPTRVEITECASLTKSIKYVRPSSCTGEEIVLNLQNNAGLEDLLMDSMFDDGKTCKYYIDLSESKLNENFFKSKKDLFKKINTAGQIFLIMREVKSTLLCDQCVWNWYNLMPEYLHSISCLGKDRAKKPKYIDQFVKDELDVC